MEGKDPLIPKECSAYIFDLDGTLFTIPVEWTKVRAEVEKLSGSPLGEAPLFMKVEQIVSVRPSLREPLFSILDKHEQTASPRAAPMPGALELISHVSKLAPMALVTMQGYATCAGILGRHLVGDLFDVVVTREDSLDRARQLGLAVKTLSVPPDHTLFTGDRLNDVICGKKAGLNTALVWKVASGEPRPDFVFPTLADLREGIM